MRAVLLALAGLLTLACFGDDDDGPVLLTRTPTPTVTATASPTATAPPTATATAVSTPTATATSSATPQPSGTPVTGDVAGVPFSTPDVRAAIEGAGVSFIALEGRGAICPETSVASQTYWTAGASTDFGAAFAIWVYPNTEAVRTDWDVTPGARPLSLVDGCDEGSGFVYWNENLVMAFAFWLSAGEKLPLGAHSESPAEQFASRAAIEAFLELTP